MRTILFSAVFGMTMLLPSIARAFPEIAQAGATPTAASEANAGATTRRTGDPLLITVEPAVSTVAVDGNLRYFERYVTPTDGAYLGMLNLQTLSPAGPTLFDLSAHNLGQPSVGGEAWLVAGDGAVVVTSAQRNSRRFDDYTGAGEPLKRTDGVYALTIPRGESGLRFSYDTVAVAGQGNASTEDWLRAVPGVELYNTYKGWTSNLGYDRELFAFHVGPEFSGDTSTLRYTLNAPPSERAAYEASAALRRTSLDNFASPLQTSVVALRGHRVLHPNLTMSGTLQHTNINDVITQNAYVSRNSNADVRLQYRGIHRTTLDVGGNYRLVDYINSLHSDVDTVDRSAVFARLTTRPASGLRLQVQDTHSWTGNRPDAINFFGQPYGSLIWSSGNEQRASLSYAPAGRMGMSGYWRRRALNNSSFRTDNTLFERGLSAWWLARDNLTLYSDALWQSFHLNGPSFDVPSEIEDSRAVVLGANYQVSPVLSLDMALADINANGTTTVNQRTLSLGADYTMKSGMRLGFRAALDDFDNPGEAPVLNYDSRWFEVSMSQFVF